VVVVPLGGGELGVVVVRRDVRVAVVLELAGEDEIVREPVGPFRRVTAVVVDRLLHVQVVDEPDDDRLVALHAERRARVMPVVPPDLGHRAGDDLAMPRLHPDLVEDRVGQVEPRHLD